MVLFLICISFINTVQYILDMCKILIPSNVNKLKLTAMCSTLSQYYCVQPIEKKEALWTSRLRARANFLINN